MSKPKFSCFSSQIDPAAFDVIGKYLILITLLAAFIADRTDSSVEEVLGSFAPEVKRQFDESDATQRKKLTSIFLQDLFRSKGNSI